jgi:hypothetical protein
MKYVREFNSMYRYAPEEAHTRRERRAGMFVVAASRFAYEAIEAIWRAAPLRRSAAHRP